MWRSCNELSQADKDKWNKRVEETNKAWGESKEKERREKVANAFGSEKNNRWLALIAGPYFDRYF